MKASDWIFGLGYGAFLITLMAVAEGNWKNSESRIANGELISEADIPTDEDIWTACCSHRDCVEGKVNVAFQGGDIAKVAIDAYQIFELETQKIFRSTNGKSYFCRRDVQQPPDQENTRCVFFGRSDYVRAR